MTLSASFVWKNPDATRDLNNRLRGIVRRGVLTLQSTPFVGDITPGAGLTVQVRPLIAVSHDGMTVVEPVMQTLPVLAGQKQYVVVRARYNEGGVPALPTLAWQVLSAAAYAIDPEKDYLIVVGTVDLAPAVLVVTLADIAYDERDEFNPLGRDWYRGMVANPAALPVPPPEMNRIGDFFFVQSDHTFHFWNGTAWEPLNTGSYNAETELQNRQVITQQRDRTTNGTGLIAGVHPDDVTSTDPASEGYAAETQIGVLLSATNDTLAFDTFSALINGHYVEVHAQEMLLPPPPAAPGDRYDIVYLELWRELVIPPAVPETHAYEGNTTLAGPPPPTFSIDQVDSKMEKLQWSSGMAVAGTNVDLDEVNAVNHSWVVLKHQLGYHTNVATTALYTPAAIAPLVQNVDGAFFAVPPTDFRLWSAAAVASSYDGVSWAIPLFVVKRSFGDTLISEFDVNNARRVFHIYPISDSDNAARRLLDSTYNQDPFAYDRLNRSIEPSGFLTGMDHELRTYFGADTIRVTPATGAQIRIRGYEDFLIRNINLAIGSAPAVVNSWSRTLVYLRMCTTLHRPGSGYFVSTRHRPLVPSRVPLHLGAPNPMGWRNAYVSYKFEYVEFPGPANYLDEDDAMTAAGWTKGDLAFSVPATQYEDGGLWSKSVPVGTDDLVSIYETEWAIPVCLVHRRNTQPWVYNTNPNGSAGRPDGHTDPATIYVDDLVDLRHDVSIDAGTLKERIATDIDKLLKGSLRTRMANKYLGSGTGGIVAGSRILQTDSIGPVAGAHNLATPDGYRRIWSDAREFHVVAAEFDLDPAVAINTDIIEYDDTVPGPAPGSYGTLKVKAPGGALPYASIVRHLPGVTYCEGDTASPEYLKFLGPPCWTTRYAAIDSTDDPTPATPKYVDTSTNEELRLEFCPYFTPGTPLPNAALVQPFAVTALDVIQRAKEMTGYVDLEGVPASARACLSWWVHYDRSIVGGYAANMGLAEIPDVVHSAVLGPTTGTPTDLSIGPLYAVVRKTGLVAALSTTITQANITSASGLPGVVTPVGVDVSSVAFSSSTHPSITAVQMNLAETALTLTFGAAYTGDVEIVVFFYTASVSNWIEVGRGGKSVQALFSWKSASIPAVPAQPYAIRLGSNIWSQIEIAGRRTNCLPIVWTKANAGDPWDMVIPTSAGPRIDYEYSNVLRIPDSILSNISKVYYPEHRALTNAAAYYINITYTYTPYQGLSATGGLAPVVGTALPKLKDMLLGTVEENSDFYATQSGACSYFSGVHTWSGLPVNRIPDWFTRDCGYVERIPEYNTTCLVDPKPARGVIEMSKSVLAENTNAAAILRLPYPFHTSMATATYHSYIADFDIDPCRAGASSGYLNFAPGYPCSGHSNYDYGRRMDQFINSLTRLDDGSSAEYDSCVSLSAADSTILDIADATRGITAPSSNTAIYIDRLRAVNPGVLATTIGICTEKPGLVSRVLTNWSNTDLGAGLMPARSGLEVLSPKAGGTLIGGLSAGVLSDYIISVNLAPNQPGWFAPYTFPANFLAPLGSILGLQSVHPGEVLSRYNTIDAGILTQSTFVGSVAGAGTTVTLRDTSVFFENDPFYVHGRLGVYNRLYRSTTDTVRFLFESGASATINGSIPQRRTTLKGTTIQYPTTWSVGTTTKLDALFSAPTDLRGAGRGLYLGATSRAYNLASLVPGSGTDLSTVCLEQHVMPDVGTVAPTMLPYMPARPLFAKSNKVCISDDHGGPLAYVFSGAYIRPASSTYNNRLVMQIVGGPTGGQTPTGTLPGVGAYFDPHDLSGTAIDAFWPTGRPLLRSRK